jgi:Flp pilus assembly protein TadD
VLQKIQAEKESSMGQYLLGEMHAASGDLVAYRTALGRALELDPDNSRARSSLAVHWAGQGRLAEAEAELLTLVQKQPLNPKFQHNYGAILLNTERGEEALAYFHRALELSPSYWRASLSLLSAELSTGRREEADSTYERLRDLCQIEGVLRQARDLMEAAK